MYRKYIYRHHRGEQEDTYYIMNDSIEMRIIMKNSFWLPIENMFCLKYNNLYTVSTQTIENMINQ